MINHLQTEIDLLESWVKRTNSGGWSTHEFDDMNRRICETKGVALFFGLSRLIGITAN